jgi:Glycosyltransferase family 87
VTTWFRGRWLWLTAASAVLTLFVAFVLIDRTAPWLGDDSHAFWAVDPSNPYTRYAPELDAFLYSPPAVLIASTFSLLPFEVFQELWRFLQVVVLVGVTGPFAGVVALSKPLSDELLAGNISIFMAAVVAFGFRWPALWAFALLTKVTPGIGLLWFAVRGEWRSLGVAIGTALAIAIPTIVFFPDLWAGWVALLAAQPADPPGVPLLAAFSFRIALAALLVMFGARYGRTWTVPFAVVLAHGHIWSGTLAVLLALIPLLRAGNLPPVATRQLFSWRARPRDADQVIVPGGS